MLTDNHYHNSILLFSYLIVNSDGILDVNEKIAMRKICEFESIQENYLLDFIAEVAGHPERKIFDMGHEEIENCTEEEKIKVFAWLNRLSEVDGDVHVKEVRFLLYSIKRAGIEFEDVIEAAAKFPSLI
jgi:hypothetical protein